MKAILEFNLPEERVEHTQAVQAGDAFYALHEIKAALRTALKHGHKLESADHALEWIQGIVFDETSGMIDE